MDLKPENLSAHLRKQLAPVYFISGDDHLRVIEAVDAVRAAARDQGYTERDVYHAHGKFDWNSIGAESGNLSLFAERRIIEVRLPTGKPGKEGAAFLREWAGQPPEDTLLLIMAGRLEPAARKSKWVQALEQAGVVMFVWPLDAEALPGWVEARMRSKGLEPTPEAAQLLAVRSEGNLLACVQEIEKLLLLNGEGPVDADTILSLVADNARYDVFALVDAALAGDSARSAHILQGLRAEGVVPQVVLWGLARELRTLAAVTAAVAAGQPASQMMSRLRVFPNRKQLVGNAATRLKPADCGAMLQDCAHIDRVSKGQATGSAWDELLQLVLTLSGKPLFPDASRIEQAS